MSRIAKQTSSRLLVLIIALLLLPGFALAAKKSTAAKVDLNTATQKELEDLPGVGEATASKIIAGRPYSSVDDLERAGIPKSTVSKIRKLVTVGKTATAQKPAAEKTEKKTSKPESKSAAATTTGGPVNLNTASQKELEDLPGVGAATAKKIIAGRPYSSVDDLAKAGVSKRTISKIGSLVTVGSASVAAKPAAASSPAASSSAPSAAERPISASTRSAPASKSASGSTESTASQQPPSKGMVWVNTATKVYHYEGDRWYGKTKEGKYMTEDDAIKAGYRASKEGPKKQ